MNQITPRLGRYKETSNEWSIVLEVKQKGGIEGALCKIKNTIATKNHLHDYNMEGLQAAETSALDSNGLTHSFKTADNKHSEIRALEYMLAKGEWVLYLGSVFKKNMSPVGKEDFSTSLSHCGHCTTILHVLGLPLEKPTFGIFNLAVNNLYPLPDEIKNSPHVVAKMLGGQYNDFHLIKKALNVYVNLEQDMWSLKVFDAYIHDYTYQSFEEPTGLHVMKWEEIDKKYLDRIWFRIFEGLYGALKK